MTNKEAITYLEWLSNIDFSKKYPTYPIVTNPEQVEALKLAITALQAQDKLQDIEHMCRLSGGADYFHAFRAISEKVENTTTFLNNLNDGVKNANNMPPVQSEDCGTCKHGYFGDEQCNSCRVRFTSHYERRTDEPD